MKKEQLKHGIQPFWFWNGAMEKAEMLRQINEMKQQGIQGFIIHPRQGMEIPYLSETYFERVEFAVARAKELEMEVWLYDEYPYPSGVTAGQVMLDHPEYLCKMLEMTDKNVEGLQTLVLDIPWGKVLYAVACPVIQGRIEWDKKVNLEEYVGTGYQEDVFQISGLTTYNHKRYFTGKQTRRLWWEVPQGNWQIYVVTEVVMKGFKYFDTYVDTMNPRAIRHFLDTTHEVYAKRLGHEFGITIKGIFTDEITAFPPERPWSEVLPKLILEKTGIRILDYLPVLFDIPMGDMTERVKYAYWNTCSDAFIESYDKQIFDWCEEHKLRFIGEKPILRSKELEFCHYPGIDAGHQKVGSKPLITPGKYRANGKIVSSAAHFYQKEGCLCEAFHSIGWGLTLQDMKWTFDWLLIHGIDWFIVHAFYYTADGLKKHDAPPSAFYQMPWWRNQYFLSDYADQLIAVSRTCKRVVPYLLVDPVTSIWTAKMKDKERVQDEFSDLQKALLKHRMDFYIVDPQLLEEGEVVAHGDRVMLQIHGEEYGCIILPSITNLEDGCFRKIKEYAEYGGVLGAVGHLADTRIMEINPKEWMETQVLGQKKHCVYGEKPDILCQKLKRQVCTYSLEDESGGTSSDVLSVEYEREDGGRFYFIANLSDRQQRVKGSMIKGYLSLAPLESGFYDLNEDGCLKIPSCDAQAKELSLEGEWSMELENDNALRLGLWNLKNEEGEGARKCVEPMPLIDQLEKGDLKIRVQPRKQFGCPKTLELPDDTYYYRTEFVVDEDVDKNNPIFLVMEPGGIHGIWKLKLNDMVFTSVDFAQKYGYAASNLAKEVSAYIKEGVNQIEVIIEAVENFDGIISPLYLMGNFGVMIMPETWQITSSPKTGWIKDNGSSKIPYFAGTVGYTKEIGCSGEELNKDLILVIRDTWLQDCVEVFWNGISMGICPWAPYRWEIPSGLFTQEKNEIMIKITNTMIGLFEGQSFDRERHVYQNFQGTEEEIEEYEAVVHK